MKKQRSANRASHKADQKYLTRTNWRRTPAIGHTPVRRTAIRRTVCKRAKGAAVLPSSNHPAHVYPAHGYSRL